MTLPAPEPTGRRSSRPAAGSGAPPSRPSTINDHGATTPTNPSLRNLCDIISGRLAALARASMVTVITAPPVHEPTAISQALARRMTTPGGEVTVHVATDADDVAGLLRRVTAHPGRHVIALSDSHPTVPTGIPGIVIDHTDLTATPAETRQWLSELRGCPPSDQHVDTLLDLTGGVPALLIAQGDHPAADPAPELLALTEAWFAAMREDVEADPLLALHALLPAIPVAIVQTLAKLSGVAPEATIEDLRAIRRGPAFTRPTGPEPRMPMALARRIIDNWLRTRPDTFHNVRDRLAQACRQRELPALNTIDILTRLELWNDLDRALGACGWALATASPNHARMLLHRWPDRLPRRLRRLTGARRWLLTRMVEPPTGALSELAGLVSLMGLLDARTTEVEELRRLTATLLSEWQGHEFDHTSVREAALAVLTHLQGLHHARDNRGHGDLPTFHAIVMTDVACLRLSWGEVSETGWALGAARRMAMEAARDSDSRGVALAAVTSALAFVNARFGSPSSARRAVRQFEEVTAPDPEAVTPANRRILLTRAWLAFCSGDLDLAWSYDEALSHIDDPGPEAMWRVEYRTRLRLLTLGPDAARIFCAGQIDELAFAVLENPMWTTWPVALVQTFLLAATHSPTAREWADHMWLPDPLPTLREAYLALCTGRTEDADELARDIAGSQEIPPQARSLAVGIRLCVAVEQNGEAPEELVEEVRCLQPVRTAEILPLLPEGPRQMMEALLPGTLPWEVAASPSNEEIILPSVSLTARQRAILVELASEDPLAVIAARQSVSVETVRSQAKAIYRKFDAHSRAEALARARAANLI